jgi:hypothetical protein
MSVTYISQLQHIHATHKDNTGIIHNHTQFSRLLLNWGGKGPLARTKLPAENAQLASDPSFSFATGVGVQFAASDIVKSLHRLQGFLRQGLLD